MGGTIFTLNSIAAVVLGGAALAGGAGSYLGTLAGAYVIAIIPSVLQFYGVSSFYKDLVQGSVLLFAVALGAFGCASATGWIGCEPRSGPGVMRRGRVGRSRGSARATAATGGNLVSQGVTPGSRRIARC